ncbi:MAG: PaaI family thioesterase [Syntrophales bacterium]|jgi:uncharacterized protein (TIGR00369 family)|nr:PaaI family thioesterase [Syntrophales bacterium]
MEHSLTQERIDFLTADFCRGFIKYCGLKALRAEQGFFESEVSISDNHRTQDNFIHAGLMATMADHTAGYSAFTTVAENFRILTIEFKINLLKPAFGNVLRCRSQVISQGKRIIVSESEVYDVRNSGEKLVAKAVVTLMAVPAERLQQN